MEALPHCLIDAVANRMQMVKLLQHNIISQLTVGMLEPTRVQVLKTCKGKGRGDYINAQKDLANCFQQQPGKHISRMYL